VPAALSKIKKKRGIGYYVGEAEITILGDHNTYAYESAIGYQVGLGATLPLSLYGEFNDNIISMKLKEENRNEIEEQGVNNWMVSVGYRF
jgi:hypothetical protein